MSLLKVSRGGQELFLYLCKLGHNKAPLEKILLLLSLS